MPPENPLLTRPMSQAEDAGKPLPASPYAVSVCLPTWKDVEEYADADSVSRSMKSNGHPRFSFHPLVQKLFEICEERFAKPGERCMAFGSEQVAQKAQEYVLKKTGLPGTVHEYGRENVFVLCAPQECFQTMQKFWQYTGQIISSRFAEHILSRKTLPSEDIAAAKNAKNLLRNRIAELSGEAAQNVALFPTGLSAVYNIHHFLRISFPDRDSVQFGFSYTDALNIQREFGNGVYFLTKGDQEDMKKLEEYLMKEKVLGIFCELPGDPLLKTIDLDRLRMLSKKYTAPIIVDDTLGTYQNFKAFAFADIVVAILSKFFSGEGNVTGGALMVNSKSRFNQMFSRVFRNNYEDLLWAEDAVVLEENSRDFIERMKKIENTTQILAEYIRNHPAVYKTYTPQLKIPEKEVYGCGGVFSFLLYNSENTTPKFYDAINISKGPGFGTNFSLLTPYLLLNLFKRKDIVEHQGLAPEMLRISVGLEEPEELIRRFDEAFAAIQ